MSAKLAPEMTQHPHLLSPGRIGSLALRNRILMCPMGDDQASDDGYVTEQQVAYFEARARGGAALLLVGSVGITAPDGLASPQQSAIANDGYLEGWTRLAEQVQRHGARLALQLVHNGKGAVNDIVAGRPMLVPSEPKPPRADPLMTMLTPSEVENMGTPAQVKGARVVYRVMTRDDIAAIAQRYADAVERAQRAGVDAIELHAGHGYLIDNFLSPTTNSRDDEYGGSVDNRARFLVDILTAIRERVGPEFPVWCRVNAEEYFTRGETLEDAVRVAQLAEAAGADALHVSAYADPAYAIGYTEAHSTHTPGRFVPYAKALKQCVQVPIITVGRIEPDHAEQILRDGEADFVAMGRKLLADPELPNRLAAGAPEDVRPCIYHYRCISQIFERSHVLCVANPLTGRETSLRIEPTEQPQRVLVVGGGPAGLEAARLAAQRGHAVTLREAGPRLGGRFALAAATAEPSAELLRWLVRQTDALDIAVELDTEVAADTLPEADFDTVIVATGADWKRPALPGAHLPHVRTVDELAPWLADEAAATPERVVIVGGDKAALGLAGVARRRGAHVEVVHEDEVFAASIGMVGRWRYVHEVREQGVVLHAAASVIAIDREGVEIRRADEDSETLGADAVWIAGGARPAPALYDALRARGIRTQAIGDCRAVGLVEGALHDATRVALAL